MKMRFYRAILFNSVVTTLQLGAPWLTVADDEVPKESGIEATRERFRKGREIYRSKCAQCHGEQGEGVAAKRAEPLIGDSTVTELAKLISETMPEVLGDLSADFRKIEALVSSEDRRILRDRVEMVRVIEKDLQAELVQKSESSKSSHAIPNLPANVEVVNDNIPQLTRMQMDLLVNSFASDFAPVATFQITNSVGQPKMKWLGIDKGHHEISHEPDTNEQAYEQMIKINTWYCEQVAYLAKRLAETPEPGGGSILDSTTLVWTNELGKGNSHTRDNIPFVMVGEGLGFQMGRALDFGKVPHNRLLMSISEAMGYPEKSFGNPDFCGDGPLIGLS